MASFQRRGKVWQYTVSRIVNGVSKPIRKSGFTTKKEAQVAAAEIETNLQKGIVPQLKPEPFDEYFEQWIKLYKTNIAKGTFENYLITLKTVMEHFKGMPIQNITKRSYQAFLNEYGQTRARNSTKNLNSHIRACVKDAIDERIIRTDFTRGVILTGEVPTKRPEEKHLSYFDSKRLLNELYQNPSSLTHHLVLLALTSGMRYAEMVGLTRKDFNFTTNEIRINKTWGYKRRMHEGFGSTKNKQSIRTIKIGKKKMVFFKQLFESAPENIHGLVFYNPQSKYKVVSNNAINLDLKRLLKELNVEPINLHGLRHTHASILLYKKVSIYYVSERLGHGDIDTTLKHYTHIVKELREQDEKNTTSIFDNMI